MKRYRYSDIVLAPTAFWLYQQCCFCFCPLLHRVICLLLRSPAWLQVRIMKDWDPSGKQGPKIPLPDVVTVHAPKEEDSPAGKGKEKDGLQIAAAPKAQPGFSEPIIEPAAQNPALAPAVPTI